MTTAPVFCVSLPRTGTRSQTQALERLGLRTLHNHRPAWRRLVCNHLPLEGPVTGDKPWGAMTHFGHFQVEQLAAAYPDAIFIRHVRDLPSWVASYGRMLKAEKGSGKHIPRLGIGDLFLPRLATFGKIVMDPVELEAAWHNHNTYIDHVRNNGIEVRDFDLTWESLCQALGLPLPKDVAGFPRSGVSK